MNYSHQVLVQEVQELRELQVFQVPQENQHLLVGLASREPPGHPETNTTLTLQMNSASSFQWLLQVLRK
jgi:hypothetical protein